MKTWNDATTEITSLSEIEKSENSIVSKLVGDMIQRRHELNLSQRDLAELSGIKQPVIARMESGVSIPRIDTLVRLAIAMGLKNIGLVFIEDGVQ